jgi:hypothetical protein
MRVLAAGAATTPDELKNSFNMFLQEQQARNSLFEGAQDAAAEVPTASGPGRLDAVNRGGNLLFVAAGRTQELRSNYGACELSRTLGHALFRLGALQCIHPSTDGSQRHRGPRCRSANRSEDLPLGQDRSQRADG